MSPQPSDGSSPHLVQNEPINVRATMEESVIDSRMLLQGRSDVWIRHGDQLYRLFHTRNNKLILTK